MIFLKLGVRNLFRNKKRTILASLAIGLGLASLILADGFWQGMLDNMIKTVTESYVGHAQVHHRSFKDTFEAQYFIPNENEIIQKLEKNPDIKAFTSRYLSIGMVASAEDSSNVNVIGLDPIKEKGTSLFDDRMLEGEYISEIHDIAIGVKLKKKLGVELGDRIVVTVTDVVTGDIQQELFRLKGVYGTGSLDFDERMILIHGSKLKEMLKVIGPQEIVIVYENLEVVDRNNSFLTSLTSSEIIAESWKKFAPQIVNVLEMSKYSMGIMSSILLALVSLGILNTMFMSLYERTYEFGVVRAIGTKNNELLKIIVSEATALAIFSIFCGIIITLLVGGYWYIYGVDYSGIQFGEVTFTERIYFVFTWEQFTFFPFIILIFTILVSLYPARHALKLSLAKALHKSL